MANYEGRFRSGYFAVKDPAAFHAWCERWGVAVITKQPGEHAYPDGAEGTLYGFLMGDDDDSGVLPYAPIDWDDEGADADPAAEVPEPPDFIEDLATQLADGWVAVIEYAGWEKLRYLSAGAIAVNNKGEREEINLGDVCDRAKQLGDFVTEASY
jgi:hypothetical protein